MEFQKMHYLLRLTTAIIALFSISVSTFAQSKGFDISRMDNWKAGRLIFKDATLPEIAEELQNWYGVKVILTGNTSKKIHFNGEFDKDKDLRSVMKAIAFINGMNYDLEGEELTLTVE